MRVCDAEQINKSVVLPVLLIRNFESVKLDQYY